MIKKVFKTGFQAGGLLLLALYALSRSNHLIEPAHPQTMKQTSEKEHHGTSTPVSKR